MLQKYFLNSALFCAVAAFIGVTSQKAFADVLLPTHDTFINEIDPNTANGSFFSTYAGRELGVETVEAYFQFDLSGYSSISSARLELHLWGQNGWIGDDSFDVHKVLSAWDEDTLTWNTRPSINGSVAATLPGDDLQANWGQWFAWDVTALVQDWIDNGGNFGMMMESDQNYGHAYFFTKEYNDDPSLRARLVVTGIPEPSGLLPLIACCGCFVARRSRKK